MHPQRSSRSAALVTLMGLFAACGGPDPGPTGPSAVAAGSDAPAARAGAAGSTDTLDNSPPTLVLKTTPRSREDDPYPVISGVAPLTVRFNLCESTDPEQNLEDPEAGDTLNWQFHFGHDGSEAFAEDGSFNPHFEHFCRTEHVYEDQGTFVATLSVTDKHLEDQSGRVASLARVTRKLTIEVGGEGPAGPAALTFCRSGLGLAIPDNGSTTDNLAVATAGNIADLDVKIAATHTFIGDLRFTLTHQDTGTSVVVFDNAGPPGPGCNDNDIDVTLDDASGASIDSCPNANATPGLSGRFSPTGALGAFNGETLAGTWRLTAADTNAADTGTLDEWCLIFRK